MKYLLLLLLIIASIPSIASPLQPAHLTCEYIENPLGIDAKQPRFAWNFTTTQRNQLQAAYELIVSDNSKDIAQQKGNVWNTGKVTANQSIQITYAGKPLRSFTKYYWRVRVYNQNNEASGWSSINSFETAMMDTADWQAQWISDGSSQPAREEDYYKADRMPLFRKTFSATKVVQSARLYISGLGYYEAYLNGNKIGNHGLDPGFTTFKREVLYAVYDITNMVKNCNNCIGVMSGNGWYNPLPLKLFGKWDLRDYQQTGRPCVKAELHIQYTDGSTAVIATNSTWQTAPGPVARNSVYLGEHYDARLEQQNWSNANAAKTAWKKAVVIDGPSGRLAAQMQPPITITKVVQPVKITQPAKDTFVVDMGQNFAGVASIKVQGKKGQRITLRYGEEIYNDGKLNVMTAVTTQIKNGNGGPGAPKIAWQEDSYTCKGDGIETWHPHFTFHGFRYIEVTGWQGALNKYNIKGLRMNSNVMQDGSFACSNSMFNQLHEAIQWTFLSNIFSVQSDCPTREKMGYGADMAVTSGAYLYNYNMAQFYTKSVTDFANEQRPEGGITELAPFTGIADKGYGDQSGPLGWELAFPFLQKQLYDFYGDVHIIQTNYPAVQRQMQFLQTKAQNNLFYDDISDHEALNEKPVAFTASAFYYQHALLAADFAGILHKTADSIQYAKLAANIKQTIIDTFYHGKGQFANNTQSAQLFALWHHLTPDTAASFTVLQDSITRRNGHLSTGIFATQMLFDVMRNHNRNDIAYSIADKRDFPGWGFMLANGATTLWETWAPSDNVYSQNHPMFGTVDEWFYRSLLGINAAAPGFKKIIIKPQPAGNLTWAKGSYTSIGGVIGSDWKIEHNIFTLKATIPANTTATIYVLCKPNTTVYESGKTTEVLKYENGYAVVEVGSGQYEFSVKQ